MKPSSRLLVVDDDANLRKTLADILRVKGYEVAAAGTGVEGIAEAKRAFVNVALIDLRLPDMTGIEVMERIKQGTSLTEAIILTGHAALDTAIEATNKGAFSYLLKPYEIEDLLQHIRHAVERQQAQQEIVRLSSFPKLSPNPIIEVESSGEITYSNPATQEFFPDLAAAGAAHPLLSGLSEAYSVFRAGGRQELVHQVKVGERIFELHISFTADTDRIRIYVLDTTERTAYEAKINGLVALLSTTLAINTHLLVAQNEDELFRFVCTALQGLEGTAGVIVCLKMPDHVLKPVAWAGFDAQMMATVDIRWDDSPRGQGVMGIAAREGRPVQLAGLDEDPRYSPWQEQVQAWQIKSAAAVPLIADGEVTGVLAVYSKRRDPFDEESIKVLADVANDIAIGVRSQRLTGRLEATLTSLRESLYGTIKAVARMIELRDPYTAGHQRRVAELAQAIGKEMGLPERQVEGLRVIGYLHDIGKIAIPAEILSKPTKLTAIEVALIRSHAKTGYDTLKGLTFPWPVAEAVLQHHERLDGFGYPAGLKGNDIILEAKVLAVADVVEAMATHRPYREALGLEAAITEISAGRGKLYDPDVVDACVRLLVEKHFTMNDEQ